MWDGKSQFDSNFLPKKIYNSQWGINNVYLLKSLRNKKDLNDITAARFLVCFLLLAAEKKTPKKGQL